MTDIILSQVVYPTLLGALAFIFIGFVLSRIFKRNDITDFLWGLGFIEVALIHFFLADHLNSHLTFRGWLVTIFTFMWGVRLSVHIGVRFFKSKTEDQRYVQFRKDWGKSEPLMALTKVFVLQGLMMAVISLPIGWAVRMAENPLTPWDFLGAALFVIGLIFESVADAQLMQFKKRPENRGKVMNTGLWALSRHPNYFGETLVWWGLFFISVNLDGGLWTVASPLLITFLLTKVSGVPMLEKLMAVRGAEFKNYIKSTPAFFPFRARSMVSFVTMILSLGVFDFIWLEGIMGDFYKAEQAPLAAALNGRQELVSWAVAGIYIFLALALQFFAVGASKLETAFRGALLGLCVYAIYDLTNLALIKNWPWKMSLVDMCWGAVLCCLAAVIGSVIQPRLAK